MGRWNNRLKVLLKCILRFNEKNDLSLLIFERKNISFKYIFLNPRILLFSKQKCEKWKENSYFTIVIFIKCCLFYHLCNFYSTWNLFLRYIYLSWFIFNHFASKNAWEFNQLFLSDPLIKPKKINFIFSGRCKENDGNIIFSQKMCIKTNVKQT